jgi:hypothetical protein
MSFEHLRQTEGLQRAKGLTLDAGKEDLILYTTITYDHDSRISEVALSDIYTI